MHVFFCISLLSFVYLYTNNDSYLCIFTLENTIKRFTLFKIGGRVMYRTIYIFVIHVNLYKYIINSTKDFAWEH